MPNEEHNKKYCTRIDKLLWEPTRDIYFGCLNVSFHTIRLDNLYTGLNFLYFGCQVFIDEIKTYQFLGKVGKYYYVYL